MSFYHKGDREEKLTKIDINATVNQAGNIINWKKYTQENNYDLDIYEVREKYDGQYRNRLKYDPEVEKAEIDHTLTLDKVFERQKALKNQWLNLPLEVRKEFDNDVNNFIDNGQTWLDTKVKAVQKERLEKQKAIEAAEKAAKEAEEKFKAKEVMNG